MKANVNELVNSLTKLIELYNKNMGYDYSVKHYEEDGEIGVFCNPTNAIVNDVTMVARAFIKNANDVIDINWDFGFIEIFYHSAKFQDNVNTMLLDMVGAL